MSSSITAFSSSSISSSGHIDGLGRRSLSFDRETGGMLERVHLLPELLAVDSLIRERVALLSTFEDERFSRPIRVERDASSGELTVLAELVTGSRISDLLEATSDEAIVPGVDVALGYLLECLPALSLFHANHVTHGLIDASRTLIRPDGRVVFLDCSFGSAVDRLGLSRQRLWTRFGIAAPAGEGAVAFDAAADVSQVSLAAVALVLGRNLRTNEYPDALPSLLMEVIEVAQIRGSSAFATGLQRFFQRSLPLPGRRPYATAEEAITDIRQLIRREIGADACRQALVDFAKQMDAAFAEPPADDDDERDVAREAAPAAKAGRDSSVPELDAFLDGFNGNASQSAVAVPQPAPDAFDDGNETELSLDNLDADGAGPEPARDIEEVYDITTLDDVLDASDMLTSESSSEARDLPEEVAEVAFVAPDVVEAREEVTAPEPIVPVAPVIAEPPAPVVPEPIAAEPVAVPIEAAPVIAPPQPAPPSQPELPEPEAAAEAVASEADKEFPSSRRRKRQQQKSARARKDKLRSSTTPKAPPPPPPVEAPKPASPSGWLVSPQRAAAFEPPVPVPPPAPALPPPLPLPPPARVSPPVPAVPSFVPTVVGPLPQPVYPSSVAASSAYGTPSTPGPALPGPLTPTPLPPPSPPSSNIQVKIKTEPPASFTPKRVPVIEPAVHVSTERFGTLGLSHGDTHVDDAPRAFPWKLAAIAVGVALIAIVVGRTYLPGRTAVSGELGAASEASPTTTPAPAAGTTPPPPADSEIPAGRGRLVIQTQPAGIKVLLDRKPVGETPLTIDVTPGRRMLTFVTAGGEVIHSARVTAGRTETVDVPVFSGWVAVFAPIVLDVAADGKSIGTTEQNRLLLSPGRHKLTLSSKEFGYSETRDVVIEPGEVASVNVDPKGSINFNAAPWAEVWLDGQKIGDTPLAGTLVPLGLREFVFKNPQFGERKISATIKASNNAPILVDFSK